MSCSVLTGCPCAMFLLHLSTHTLFVAILFFRWGLQGGKKEKVVWYSFFVLSRVHVLNISKLVIIIHCVCFVGCCEQCRLLCVIVEI